MTEQLIDGGWPGIPGQSGGVPRPDDLVTMVQDGSFRAIKVTVDQPSGGDKRIALTRSGRIARKENQSTVRPPAVRMPSTTPSKP